MNVLSIEIKSRTDRPDEIETLLRKMNARYAGEDRQVDTYFHVNSGRLKLRQGNIENTLIYYERPESKELKRSAVSLQKLPPENQAILEILSRELGIRTVVAKTRKIFFIGNVKFHIDQVEGLGSFVEIEALGSAAGRTEEELSEQCEFFIRYLQLDRGDFIDRSYSDLIDHRSQDK